MTDDKTKRGAKEGIAFGLIAGIIFAAIEIIVAAAGEAAPLTPLRLFASIVLGADALQDVSIETAVVVGAIVHMVLSAAFGLIYGLANAQFSRETETSWGRQVGLGLLFGVMLWVVNFHIIARALYPWFLETPQFVQMVLHALCFGLPLALMYAGAERRVHLGPQTV